MADFPALPLWTDAYLADTRHLSTLEHGAYLLLLMEAWRRPHCDLPDNDMVLSRLAGLPLVDWEEIKPVVMAFWTRDGRRKVWTQKRQKKERLYVAQKSQSQRDKVAKRWDKEKNPDTTVIPNGYRSDTPTPTPTIPLSNDNGRAAPDADKVFWDGAKDYLSRHGSKNPGGLIGKWIKGHGKRGAADAITAAQIAEAVEPVSYIEATLRRSREIEERPVC